MQSSKRKVLLLIKSEGVFGRGLLLGIAEYALTVGNWSFLHIPNTSVTELRQTRDTEFDGIIYDLRETKRLQGILSDGIARITVAPDLTQPRLPAVINDWQTSSKIAAEHLLEQGFRNFAFCGYSGLIASDERKAAFLRYINEAGFDVLQYSRVYEAKDRPWDIEEQLLIEWFRSLPKPVGIMAYNDVYARQILVACLVGNIKVPEEIAVIGVDNDEVICRLANPPLSSIPINTKKAGYEAGALLDRLIDGEKMSSQRIIAQSMDVVKRRSTDFFAVKDPKVSAALRFIHDNARLPIRVKDVFKHIGISRNNLYTKFKKELKYSLGFEIRRVRLSCIKNMLENSDLSIGQISGKMRMGRIKNLNQFFTRETGMSPVEYRRKHQIKK